MNTPQYEGATYCVYVVLLSPLYFNAITTTLWSCRWFLHDVSLCTQASPPSFSSSIQRGKKRGWLVNFMGLTPPSQLPSVLSHLLGLAWDSNTRYPDSVRSGSQWRRSCGWMSRGTTAIIRKCDCDIGLEKNLQDKRREETFILFGNLELIS